MSSGENQHNSYAQEPPVVYLPPHTAGPGNTENVRSAYLPRRHGLSITSLVLGIVSIVLVFSTTVSFSFGHFSGYYRLRCKSEKTLKRYVNRRYYHWFRGCIFGGRYVGFAVFLLACGLRHL
jgi:hypothetical protein